MTSALLLRLVVNPTLAWLGGMGVRSDDRTRVMLLAIALQESKLRHRWQVLDGGRKGAARGFWQFERGGGVYGVLHHDRTAMLARDVCEALVVQPMSTAVWEAIEQNDVLACSFARLLLWSDPQPLPGVEQTEQGWHTYMRLWRPGKPHPETWANHWDAAFLAVNEG